MKFKPTIHSYWPDGSTPQYLNPTFEELSGLFKDQWDTIRILADETAWALASGHGNTHETIVKAWKSAYGVKRTPVWTAWILHHSRGQAYLYFDGLDEYTKAIKSLRYFTKEQAEFLKDLIRERGLAI